MIAASIVTGRIRPLAETLGYYKWLADNAPDRWITANFEIWDQWSDKWHDAYVEIDHQLKVVLKKAYRNEKEYVLVHNSILPVIELEMRKGKRKAKRDYILYWKFDDYPEED